jgi:hypothetical protein
VVDDVGPYLARELSAGNAVLFTGAGFSRDACDRDGRPIPSGPELADELWTLCFGDTTRDESELEDLFEHALLRNPCALDELVRRRLSVDPASVPSYYARWLALPWRRAYTLNVDDIEVAVAARHRFDRAVAPCSALSADADPARLPNPGDALAFVHLNGCVDASPRGITFSRSQYAGRLASLDAFYERLTDDLLALPFVFVGTKLDESPLWQNLERRASLDDGHRVMRPRSFLVTARLDRARRALLEHVCIEWIQCSAQSFAERVLASLGPQVVAAGRTALRTPRNT